jgi:FKBP-type peptidyl-prolyl cis-trans isomerase 2
MGNTVRVHYTGRLEDGTVFDSTLQRGPFEYTLGSGQAVAGFDKAVVGMTVGEKKTVTLSPREAFGRRQEMAIARMKRNQLPGDVEPRVGQSLRISWKDGRESQVIVTAVNDSIVTLDTNHPLAGRTVTFDIELVGIV